MKANKLHYYVTNGKQGMLHSLSEHEDLYQHQQSTHQASDEEEYTQEAFRSSSVLRINRGEAEQVRKVDTLRHTSSVNYLERHQKIIVAQKIRNE